MRSRFFRCAFSCSDRLRRSTFFAKGYNIVSLTHSVKKVARCQTVGCVCMNRESTIFLIACAGRWQPAIRSSTGLQKPFPPRFLWAAVDLTDECQKDCAVSFRS